MGYKAKPFLKKIQSLKDIDDKNLKIFLVTIFAAASLTDSLIHRKFVCYQIFGKLKLY
jgi:hypothetical protein